VIHMHAAATDPASLAITINTAVGPNMWDQANSTSVVEEIHITKLDGSSATYVYLTGGGANYHSATSSGTIIPQACALVKLTTAFRGRRHRGRIYLPFVADGKAPNGLLLATRYNNVTAGWTSFRTTTSAAGADLVVASYTEASFKPVTSLSCEIATATQRRRQPR